MVGWGNSAGLLYCKERGVARGSCRRKISFSRATLSDWSGMVLTLWRRCHIVQLLHDLRHAQSEVFFEHYNLGKFGVLRGNPG